MQARPRHLERLVQVLKSQRRENSEAGSNPGPGESTNGQDADDEEPPITCKKLSETAGYMVDDLRYVNSTNWEAILDDV